jgi:hypothetical protein
MPGSPQDELSRIDVTPDFVALCRRLDGTVARSRMRALALMAEAYEAEMSVPVLQAA